ncbi:MAG: hypothetical protein K8T25_02605 [Planctomycetia bacterium]|nr:hypothetical protein [Planctomycetia bacterium]
MTSALFLQGQIVLDSTSELPNSPPAPRLDRPPLGLPSGSVRALLTLLIVGVVIVEVIRGNPVKLLWTETLMIVLAHYFTSRRFVRLPPDVVKQLETAGHLESETNPLWLPRHSIRALVILAFVGLAVYQYQEHRLFQAETLSILITVFAYLIGVVGRGVLDWWFRSHGGHRAVWWDDLKAATVLLVLGATAMMYFIGRADSLPEKAHLATLGLVLFYFGSR